MRQIIALAIKDLRLLLRDKTGFFFTFFFPLLIAVFFGSIFSGSGDGQNAMPLLIVDEDGTEQSQAFVATLESAPELQVRLAGRQEAMDLVRRGKSVAYVVLLPGFGQAREQIFWGEPPRVELGVDPARRAEAGMIQGILTKYAAERLQELLSDPGAIRDNIQDALGSLPEQSDIPAEIRDNLQRFLGDLDRFLTENPPEAEGEFHGFQPIAIDEVGITVEKRGPSNAYAISFPQGIIWGIIGCTAAFGISMVTERARGTLVRLLMAPISRLQILAGKALACFITTISLSVGLFALAMLVFGLRPSSLTLLALAIVSPSLAFVGIMMFLSVLGKTEQAAGGIGWALLLMMAMLGGGMIPLFFMPSWMRTISHFSPVKWSILAMEGAIWRQFSFDEMLRPCRILLAIGVVFFSVGVRAFRWSEGR